MQEIRSLLTERDWVLSEEERMDVFSIPRLEVATDTEIYKKRNITSSVGLEMPVFIFVSKLDFSADIPSLGMELIRGIVKRESKKRFMRVLENKGLQDVSPTESRVEFSDDKEINHFTYQSCYSKDDEEYIINSGCFILHNSNNYYILGYSKPKDMSILILESNQTVDIESEISTIVDSIV